MLRRSLIIAAPGTRAAAIARAAAVLTLGLGLELIAEGLETPLQLARLRQLRCDRGQGYLFGRPRPASIVESERAGIL